ncbi:MAG TPA: polysaccharide biosynthesis/export family protein [Steroidobacteraceae bacterium]|jgi:polysaccharide export outer membrane protein|nr:polysaccharide biosynthesis/export family protein [Steroidobacteraceae bacterium]
MQPALILSLALLSALAVDAAAAQQPATMAAASDAAKAAPAAAAAQDAAGAYLVQPGDVLTVTVWKETDLTGDVLVRPDFGLSFPLVGDLDAHGKTVDELREEITARLTRYIPSPVVTVAAKTVAGNHIYVVGRVQKPGEYPMARDVDVMQALSLAGGATPFAAVNDIIILRRLSAGQIVLHFQYNDVARGQDLRQNILLQPGDTVVVP